MKHRITCLNHCCDLHEEDLDNVIKKVQEDIIYDFKCVIAKTLKSPFNTGEKYAIPLFFKEWEKYLQKLKEEVETPTTKINTKDQIKSNIIKACKEKDFNELVIFLKGTLEWIEANRENL